MPIVNPVPYNIVNGTVTDAVPVMANFQSIANDVNTNAAKNGANSDITSLSALASNTAFSVAGGSSFSLAASATITLITKALTIPAASRSGKFALMVWGSAQYSAGVNGQPVALTVSDGTYSAYVNSQITGSAYGAWMVMGMLPATYAAGASVTLTLKATAGGATGTITGIGSTLSIMMLEL